MMSDYCSVVNEKSSEGSTAKISSNSAQGIIIIVKN